MGSRKKLSENEILEQLHNHSGSEIDFSDEENTEEIIYYEKPSQSENLQQNNDYELSENIDEEIIDDMPIENIDNYMPIENIVDMQIENIDDMQSTLGATIQNFEFEIIEDMPSTSGVEIIDNNRPSTSGIENIDCYTTSISGALENDNDLSMHSDNEVNNFQLPISACIPTVRGGRRARTRGGIQSERGVPRRGRGIRMRGVRGQRVRGAHIGGPRGARMRGSRGRGRGHRAPIDLVLLEQIDKDLGWSANDIPPPTLPDFIGDFGIKVPLDQTSTEYDCFQIFFTEDVLKNIKGETNKYAYSFIQELKRKNQLKKNSLWNKWKPTTLPELKGFFSIIIHMGLVKKPEISDYWSRDPVLHTPFAGNIMTRDRFKMILYALHLNDNRTYIPKGQPNHDPIHKIWPYWDTLVQKCSSSFYPNCDLTIDEGMVTFRGRVSFKVYNKNKPDYYYYYYYYYHMFICEEKKRVASTSIYRAKIDTQAQ